MPGEWGGIDPIELVALEAYWEQESAEWFVWPQSVDRATAAFRDRVRRAERDVPRLLAEVRRLRAKLERIRYAAGE